MENYGKRVSNSAETEMAETHAHTPARQIHLEIAQGWRAPIGQLRESAFPSEAPLSLILFLSSCLFRHP